MGWFGPFDCRSHRPDEVGAAETRMYVEWCLSCPLHWFLSQDLMGIVIGSRRRCAVGVELESKDSGEIEFVRKGVVAAGVEAADRDRQFDAGSSRGRCLVQRGNRQSMR